MFLAVIGDVSGKGLPASFYMSKLQTMVRIYAKTNHSPKKILEEINRSIFGELVSATGHGISSCGLCALKKQGSFAVYFTKKSWCSNTERNLPGQPDFQIAILWS